MYFQTIAEAHQELCRVPNGGTIYRNPEFKLLPYYFIAKHWDGIELSKPPAGYVAVRPEWIDDLTTAEGGSA